MSVEFLRERVLQTVADSRNLGAQCNGIGWSVEVWRNNVGEESDEPSVIAKI